MAGSTRNTNVFEEEAGRLEANDGTLGGYLQVHQRPPAFEGSDGGAYSVGLYVDDTPDASGRFGAALLFVRWSPNGEEPTGHLESDYLAFGDSPAAAEAEVRRLTLHQIKACLDGLIRPGSEG